MDPVLGDRPLDGIRVVDFTAFWAGPAATQMLAALGADVIKVESASRPDGMRFNSTKKPSDPDWWEWSPVFQSVNTDKRDLTLDLATEEGQRLAFELIKKADVVIENYSPRVLDGFGITWETVHQANPQAIMVRMPGFGLTGPWRDRTGFAQTMEQISGMAWVSGYADGLPVIPRGACDPLAGMHAVFALLAALEERDRSCIGRFIEVSMVEAALNAAAEVAIEYSAYGQSIHRQGNRGPVGSPQGVYPCLGTEQWLALSIATDEQWTRFVDLLGSPDWAVSVELVQANGRRDAHDEIDKRLGAHFAGRDLYEAVQQLANAGIPVAPVVSPLGILDHEQVRSRGFAEPLDHSVVGRHEFVGIPFRFDSIAGQWFRKGSPTLGQHNHEVLSEVLGLTDPEIVALEVSGVIGNRPPG